MSFADDLDEAYFSGIKPAIEQDCGMEAVRMKELHHNLDICDRLLSEIRQAQFVIAEFTGHRNGVYYEAGFARALGREVINCCREDDFVNSTSTPITSTTSNGQPRRTCGRSWSIESGKRSSSPKTPFTAFQTPSTSPSTHPTVSTIDPPPLAG
jgi:hypothetical protein